ncbi:MAG: 50S ribosomal protein L3 [SAR324 cluster bacterium]|uniref:Large ribosomal subunit protein uL3 n=1 Tax=SAR324 cluster bacterium TaxID=2024889 RepID=A0A7X9FNZ5_9DELT|nr:50S ribosomal protein L3 [SAR324 cluster bacterium]
MTSERINTEGLLGRKLGMTQVFTQDGQCVPVTAIEVGPCYIVQLKTVDKDGYDAVQIGFQPKKPQRTNKALMGHFAGSGKGAFYHVREVRCDAAALGWTTLGQELCAKDLFGEGARVDISGVSIGRGFTGVVRRYGMKGQPATRGTHEYRRNIGSIGCRKTPGRVFKNKRMPVHYGNENVTVQNLQVIEVKPEQNVILVKGAVPGSRGGIVVVRKSKRSVTAKKAA